MKFQKKFVVVMLTICLMELGGTVFSAPVYAKKITGCLLYTSPSPRDLLRSRMPSSA